MMKYARSDTHFLLYIYDNLRNALIDRSQSRSQSRSPRSSPPPAVASLSNPKSPARHSLLNRALERSAETSLRVYTKEPYDAAEGSGSNGWDTLAKRWNKGALMAGGPGVGVGTMQRVVYKSVHGWRERIAREEDESTRWVCLDPSFPFFGSSFSLFGFD
jgi:exosome complex exonuclease RRP6